MLCDDPPFHRTFSIAFQQGRGRTQGGGEDKAIIIRAHGARIFVPPRSQHSKMRSAVIELVSFFLHRDRHARAHRLRHDRCEFAHRLVDADPKLPRMEIRHDCRHPSKVIGVGMSDHDPVETIDAAIPEVRRDNLLADIKVGVRPLRQAPGINQQNATQGRDQQNGVALSDIDARHLHHAGAQVRARRNESNPAGHGCKQREGRGGSDARSPC